MPRIHTRKTITIGFPTKGMGTYYEDILGNPVDEAGAPLKNEKGELCCHDMITPWTTIRKTAPPPAPQEPPTPNKEE